MIAVPQKVYIVVDREFGERVEGLAPGVPVWIVDTPVNRPVAERLWKERRQESHLTGITTFKDSDSSSPEDILVSEFDTIDLHHNSYSSDLPYTVVEVLGTPLSGRIEAELSEYGFKEFHSSSAGFCAIRHRP